MSNRQAEGETERKRDTNRQKYGGHSQENTENCQLNSAERGREKEGTERGTYRQNFGGRIRLESLDREKEKLTIKQHTERHKQTIL